MASSPPPAFVYQDVVREDQIRLVRIDGFEGGTLKCSLTPPIDTASPPPYFTLSWCWGDLPESKEISLDGERFLIKPNLQEALSVVYRFFEKQGSHPYLWVDAICINQSGRTKTGIFFQEKPGQVRSMHRVYGSAVSVLIWLGSEQDDDKLGISFLDWYFRYHPVPPLRSKPLTSCVEALHSIRKIEALEDELEGKYRVDRTALRSMSTLIDELADGEELSPEILERLKSSDFRGTLPEKDHPLWSAFNSLRERPYYGRVWTFQEAALGQDTAIFFCGDTQIPSYVFNAAEKALLRSNSFTDFFGNFQISVGDLVGVRPIGVHPIIWPGDQRPDYEHVRHFTQLLIIQSLRNAKDKRDFVYGLLGLVSSAIRSRIDIDYLNLQPEDVFTQATKLICEMDESMYWYWLLVVYLKRCEPTVENLPSWCLDYSSGTSLEINQAIFPGSFTLPQLELNPFFEFFEFPDSRVLMLKGLRLDSVHDLMKTCLKLTAREPDRYLENVRDWLVELRDFLTASSGDEESAWRKFQSILNKDRVKSMSFDEFKQWVSAMEHMDSETWYSFHKGSYSIDGLDSKAFWDLVFSQTGRYFFFTENGRLGFAPRYLERDVQICFIQGPRFFMAVSPDLKRLISYAVINGMMSYDALGFNAPYSFEDGPELSTFYFE